MRVAANKPWRVERRYNIVPMGLRSRAEIIQMLLWLSLWSCSLAAGQQPPAPLPASPEPSCVREGSYFARGAHGGRNTEGKSGLYPLHMAARSGDKAILVELLAKGADPTRTCVTFKGCPGATARQMVEKNPQAVANGCLEVVPG